MAGPHSEMRVFRGLAARAGALPPPVADIAQRGLQTVVDFQDCAYGATYLDRLDRIVAEDRVDHGWRLRSHTLRSFVLLHVLGGLRGYRLRTLRHAVEVVHLETWLRDSLAPMSDDYDLCVELLSNRRLFKGYSDTHARGMTKFSTVMGAAHLLRGRPDAADWMRRLHAAALQDPDGKALEGALATVRSFA